MSSWYIALGVGIDRFRFFEFDDFATALRLAAAFAPFLSVICSVTIAFSVARRFRSVFCSFAERLEFGPQKYF